MLFYHIGTYVAILSCFCFIILLHLLQFYPSYTCYFIILLHMLLFYHIIMNRHLIVVEGFEHPNDPRSYVVQGLMPLVGSPKANRS